MNLMPKELGRKTAFGFGIAMAIAQMAAAIMTGSQLWQRAVSAFRRSFHRFLQLGHSFYDRAGRSRFEYRRTEHEHAEPA
jgi:hypothetical protein